MVFVFDSSYSLLASIWDGMVEEDLVDDDEMDVPEDSDVSYIGDIVVEDKWSNSADSTINKWRSGSLGPLFIPAGQKLTATNDRKERL